jgi:hypothetical protein
MGENWRHQWDKSGVISEGNLASWVGEIWRDWLEKSGVIGEEIFGFIDGTNLASLVG